MQRYNHIFQLAFSVPQSPCPTGKQIPAEVIEAALFSRIEEIKCWNSWTEAIGLAVETELITDLPPVLIRSLPKQVSPIAQCEDISSGKTYNHAFIFPFHVANQACKTGEDVTPDALMASVLARYYELKSYNGWVAGVEGPYDTYEEEAD